MKIVGFSVCRCVHGIHGYRDPDSSIRTASNLRNFLFNGSHQAEFRCVGFQCAILLYFRIVLFYSRTYFKVEIPARMVANVSRSETFS